MNLETLFELFYNLANEFSKKRRLTALTDILTFYNIVSELMFLLPITKGLIHPMKNEYIEKIENLLPLADEDLLDFVFQLLQKSISPSLTETQTQPA